MSKDQTLIDADFIRLSSGDIVPIGSLATGIPGAKGEKGEPGQSIKGDPGDGTIVRPEDYGAKGDGITDDGPAFRDMLAHIPMLNPRRKKIYLNPSVYYSIQSGASDDNVFEITINNLSFEGQGLGQKVIGYDGDAEFDNFFYVSSGARADYLRFRDMMIWGHETKIQNILKLDGAIGFSAKRSCFHKCENICITGFNWWTVLEQCSFSNARVGLDPVVTTATVTACYANNCTIGYSIWSRYAAYIGCACDWADEAYKMGEPWSVALIGCGCEQSKQAITGTAIQLSVQAFQVDQTGMTDLPQACFDLYNTSGQITAMFGKINNQCFLKARGCPNLVVGPEFPADKKLIL